MISIIVPIYNVEQYLKRCVDSLINQTYRNLEIILVDDGSPDRCGEICDEYAKKDSRVKAIHKPNGGLSDARNKGLDVATGDYVMFVDSDDWLESNTCEIISRMAFEYHADVVVFGMNLVYDNGNVVRRGKGIVSHTPSQEQCILSLIYRVPESGLFNNVCNKMFRRELFDNIEFPLGRLAEDRGVILKLMHKAKSVYVCENCFYNYYKRSGSISISDYSPRLVNDRFYFDIERLDFIRKNYPKFGKYQIAQMLGDIYICNQKLRKIEGYTELKNSLIQFSNQYKGQEKHYSKYNKRVMVHYYCYPLFWLYVKFFVK